MGNLVLQRGLANAIRHSPNMGADVHVTAPRSGSTILRELASGGINMTVTFAAPDVDHANMDIMLNNLSWLCPCTLYTSSDDAALGASSLWHFLRKHNCRGRAGYYHWPLPARFVRSNHDWHFYLHPVVQTIKLSGRWMQSSKASG